MTHRFPYDTVRLHAASMEYLTFTVIGAPSDAVIQVRPEGAESWSPTERTSDLTVRVLIAGPDVATPTGAVVLPIGSTGFELRWVANPEDIVKEAGRVVVAR